jgi:hypothetical protein
MNNQIPTGAPDRQAETPSVTKEENGRADQNVSRKFLTIGMYFSVRLWPVTMSATLPFCESGIT